MKRTKNSNGKWITLTCKWLGNVLEWEERTGKTLEQCVKAYAKEEKAKVVRIIRRRTYCMAEFCHA